MGPFLIVHGGEPAAVRDLAARGARRLEALGLGPATIVFEGGGTSVVCGPRRVAPAAEQKLGSSSGAAGWAVSAGCWLSGAAADDAADVLARLGAALRGGPSTWAP